MRSFKIEGEPVVVVQREQVGTLPGNTPEYGEVETTVENVLVAPGARDDVSDAARQDGTTVVFNLHFPKTFSGSLRNASIKVRGGEPLAVVGDPRPYTDANTPGDWNLPVEVERVDG
ncbi:hypothetical protein [Arthrobacter rhombi]|uniref:hypothetical protein n=1 Tax=Arthrobacter rhombi TaxID=71253 RepID=UPI003FD2BC67